MGIFKPGACRPHAWFLEITFTARVCVCVCVCTPPRKESAYLTLVRLCLEYAACAWDPYQLFKKEIEKVQRRAIRWTLSDYSRYNSVTVTDMLSQLQWATLEQRRYIIRLYFTKFYMIMISLYRYHHTSYQHSTLQDSITSPNHFILPPANTNQYQLSYFPRTIKDWNTLPLAIIESPSSNKFVCSLKTLLN